MTLLIVAVVVVFVVVAVAGVIIYAQRAPVAEPSPRPKRDDKVAVLEGGAGRSWD